MSRTPAWFGTLFLMMVLSGCAASRQAPSFADTKVAPPREGTALVYVFRDRAEPTAWGATVHLGESKLATLKEDGFTWAYLAPGEHRVTLKWPLLSGQRESSFTLNVVANETYYLELVGVSRLVSGPPSWSYQTGSGFAVRDARAGGEAISRCCRFQPPTASQYPPAP